MKINLSDIPAKPAHSDTIFKKRLLTDKGRIATCNYAWVEKGKQLETHRHEGGEEFYLFLEGEGEMLVDDKWIPVRKGDFVTIPKNNDHSLKNHKDQNLLFLQFRTLE